MNNNIPSRFWNATIGTLGLLTIFLVIISIKEIKSIGYVGVNLNSTNMVTVQGSGEAVAIPDIATFSFSVTETAKTVADAQAAATTKTNAALKAIKDAGVEDRDVSTESYNINPHYEYDSCATYSYVSSTVPPCRSKSVLTGYDVSQSIRVKVRKIEDAGALFTSIGGLGVQNVSGLTFSVDEPDKYQAEARAEAIAKAQTKAKELAKQLDVSLVRIVSFNDNDNYYPRPIYGLGGDMAMEAKVSSAPSIPAGEQKITANVTITYEIR